MISINIIADGTWVADGRHLYQANYWTPRDRWMIPQTTLLASFTCIILPIPFPHQHHRRKRGYRHCGMALSRCTETSSVKVSSAFSISNHSNLLLITDQGSNSICFAATQIDMQVPLPPLSDSQLLDLKLPITDWWWAATDARIR